MGRDLQRDEFRYWEHARPAGVSEQSISKVISLIKERAGNTGLGIEVGCGFGQYTAHLPNAIGVDLSYSLLRNIKGARSVAGDARFLPFKPDTFDFLFINSLHHMSEEAVVPELLRVLKSGKPMFLLEPNLLHPVRFFCMRNKLLFPEHSPDEKAFDPYKLGKLLEKNGAHVESLKFLTIEMFPKSWRGWLQDILKLVETRWSQSWFFMEAVKNENK